MKKNEKFPWPLEEGTAMDFADGELILAVKDEDWNDSQLESAKNSPFSVLFCETNGLIIALLEGGPLDTCDFYFNIQECDAKDELLACKNLPIQAVLIDGQNNIAEIKSTTLSSEKTEELRKLFEKQAQMEFMPGEYDVNLDGMLAAFEPAELARYGKVSVELK